MEEDRRQLSRGYLDDSRSQTTGSFSIPDRSGKERGGRDVDRLLSGHAAEDQKVAKTVSLLLAPPL